jgi:hypothetical protein
MWSRCGTGQAENPIARFHSLPDPNFEGADLNKFLFKLYIYYLIWVKFDIRDYHLLLLHI